MMTFQSDSGVTPDLGTNRVEANWYGSGTLVTTILRDPETETGHLETEKRVHRTHGTLCTGLHMMLRSLVAPSRGAGRYVSSIIVSWFHCRIGQTADSQPASQPSSQPASPASQPARQSDCWDICTSNRPINWTSNTGIKAIGSWVSAPWFRHLATNNAGRQG